LRTHPKSEFFIYDGKIYLNNTNKNSVSLYDGLSGSYPFVYKNGSKYFLKTTLTSSFDEAIFGTVFSGSYPQVSSIVTDIYEGPYANNRNERIMGLRNSFDSYTHLSRHYTFDGTEYGNKAQQDASLVSIPSIFYGSTIKRKTAKARFFISGTLAGEAHDIYGNGEMIQTLPVGSNGSGSVAGVVLYNEGFMFLTGSWNLNAAHTETYGAGSTNPRWQFFGTTKTGIPSSSFAVEFEGTQDVPTMTMFAHADKGELNNSTNPTFVVSGSDVVQTTGSYEYIENSELEIKNVTATAFNTSGSFEKSTYISTVGIFDDEKNLIATAKLAKPLRKRERDSYTFKLKLDL